MERERHETFADYFAHYLGAVCGYARDPLPDVHALYDACDTVMTTLDDQGMRIACIVDRTLRPYAGFAMPATELRSLARICGQRFASGGNNAVAIRIYEIGADANGPTTQSRLADYGPPTGSRRIEVSGWAIDPVRRTIWTNAPMKGLFSGRPMIGRLLQRQTRTWYLRDDPGLRT